MHGLPPLNGLRAFEAAARHSSLTKAAAELNVSPGAISHQIRGLEALLGVELFERRVRAIVLTAAGKLLYPGLQTVWSESLACWRLSPSRTWIRRKALGGCLPLASTPSRSADYLM